MSWEKDYQSKLTDADKALDFIKSGERVVIGHACGEPSYLVETMVSKAEQYENVEIVHMVAMGKAGYAQPGMEKHFRHNALFVGGTTRKAVSEGRGDYTPCFFYRIPALFTNGSLPVDVALVQAAAPDANGNMSLGISVDYTLPAVRAAKKVIVQVNKELPRTYGDSTFHISDANVVAVVEHDAPIIELAPPKITEIEKAIGANCAKLINDGDTLQLGIGAIPDAVLMFLGEKKDLGIHSEMFSDGVVGLVEKGVITNAKKTTHKGKFVANFLMGTRRLYDFVNNNPDVEMYPVDYVNNPVVVMKEDNIVSINSCVQIDLMGQAASETVGYTQISGVGGQVDFIRGASMAKNGRSILAFPSTAAKGTVSKIVPLLDEGAAVTTSRNDIDYVVTEYGIAKLSGRTLKERAKALIEIAHPDFREGLKKVYEERFHCAY
ncbi:acetyl-CoA hydrolase/transferase family protein [bacterium 1XD42-94]|nr:acetyl-CoA hydrolase/transferase family protein [bacterium 1XD42-76]NBK06725.1 acetyl-CoA hydrolase/transferase family protein [bacterium 1XD42-94]